MVRRLRWVHHTFRRRFPVSRWFRLPSRRELDAKLRLSVRIGDRRLVRHTLVDDHRRPVKSGDTEANWVNEILIMERLQLMRQQLADLMEDQRSDAQTQLTVSSLLEQPKTDQISESNAQILPSPAGEPEGSTPPPLAPWDFGSKCSNFLAQTAAKLLVQKILALRWICSVCTVKFTLF